MEENKGDESDIPSVFGVKSFGSFVCMDEYWRFVFDLFVNEFHFLT